MRLEGWGRYPRHESEVYRPSGPAEAAQLMSGASGSIARGNGRAYGDAAIGQNATLKSGALDRMKAFDPQTGLLTVEAGVLLRDVIATFMLRGWFPPVVPGTKLVTIGGMIAADVHGKNHHRDGGFGRHVEELVLALPGGEIATCSRDQNAELFNATIGGMGLTGFITQASFRMRPIETGWIVQHTIAAGSLAEALAALAAADEATYSVAWIDCLATGSSLGRSLIYTGEHASRDEVRFTRHERDMFPKVPRHAASVPVDLPGWTLNRHSVAAFNSLYFRCRAARSDAPTLVHWDPYFFPLDGIAGWNRLYGRKGFLQHQSVVPAHAAEQAYGAMLELIARSGRASFLAVLKKLGAGDGTMSFPMPGYTLALDVTATDDVHPLLAELDRIVVAAGGRLYLAKDARQSRATFEAGYPALSAFKDLRRAIFAEGHVASRLSERLGL